MKVEELYIIEVEFSLRIEENELEIVEDIISDYKQKGVFSTVLANTILKRLKLGGISCRG